MIDLHCHILPGIDDGAPDLEESLSMAEAARAEGIRLIAATPHHNKARWDNPADRIRELTDRLNGAIAERGLDVRIVPGQEMHVNGRFFDEWQAGRVQPIGESRYVLIEFPFDGLPRNAAEVVHELTVAGLVPIIAHPERNRAFLENPDLLEELIRTGALGQLTSHSLLGTFGRHVQRRSEEMISRGLVHILASDAHRSGTDGRGFRLNQAYEAVTRKFGDACAETFMANAEAVVAGRSIDPEPKWAKTARSTGKKRLFGWLPGRK
jgi:protein-tyrosine phosphatase